MKIIFILVKKKSKCLQMLFKVLRGSNFAWNMKFKKIYNQLLYASLTFVLQWLNINLVNMKHKFQC